MLLGGFVLCPSAARHDRTVFGGGDSATHAGVADLCPFSGPVAVGCEFFNHSWGVDES